MNAERVPTPSSTHPNEPPVDDSKENQPEPRAAKQEPFLGFAKPGATFPKPFVWIIWGALVAVSVAGLYLFFQT